MRGSKLSDIQLEAMPEIGGHVCISGTTPTGERVHAVLTWAEVRRAEELASRPKLVNTIPHRHPNQYLKE